MLKTLGALLVGAVMLAAGPAAAQTTYSYNGNLYDTFTNFSNCTSGGGCANFSNTMRPVGTFQTATPLAGGLNAVDITAQVTAYDFSDGLTDYESTDPQSRLYWLYVSTDAAGNLTQLAVVAQRWRSLGYAAICDTYVCNPGTHPVAAYVDASNKHDQMIIEFSNPVRVAHNLSCARRGTSPSGTAEICMTSGGASDPNPSRASAPNAPYPVIAAPAPVPTMTEWAMILFGLILAGGAAMTIQRRRMI